MRGLASAALAVAWLCAGASPAAAHHGWGVFDVEAPLFVEGRIVEVYWGNPHPTVTIELGAPVTGDPWRAWTVPEAWRALGAGPVLDRVRVDPELSGRVLMEFGSLHRQPMLGLPQPPQVGESMRAIVFPSCRRGERTQNGAMIMRPTLIEYGHRVLSQQSHRLPRGCSGRRTADF